MSTSAEARAKRISAALAGLLEQPPRPPTGETTPAEAEANVAAHDRPSCPACATTMQQRFAESQVVIDQCPACDGIWLDVGELDALVRPPIHASPSVAEIRKVMAKHARAQPVVEYRKCPRCGDVMNRRNFGDQSGVVIDECVHHGVYLDAGEFEAITEFVRLGGLELRKRLPRPPMPAPPEPTPAWAQHVEHRTYHGPASWLLRWLIG